MLPRPRSTISMYTNTFCTNAKAVLLRPAIGNQIMRHTLYVHSLYVVVFATISLLLVHFSLKLINGVIIHFEFV